MIDKLVERWSEMNRRTFLGSTSAALASAVAGSQTAVADDHEIDVHDLTLTVNDQPYSMAVDPRTSLLDLLREHLALTGAKKDATTASAAHVRYIWMADGSPRA